ncbi:MAG: hypothetical protein HY751_00845 [Nitrospinae bacterium]|nr:hypothetical protein [Nitrospinota bacterium]
MSRNPFIFGNEIEIHGKSGQTVSRANGVKVEMTLIQGDKKLAVINGEKKTIGDMVGSAKILEITAEGVELSSKGRRWVCKVENR